VLAFYLLARALTAIRLMGAYPLRPAPTSFAFSLIVHDDGRSGAGDGRHSTHGPRPRGWSPAGRMAGHRRGWRDKARSMSRCLPRDHVRFLPEKFWERASQKCFKVRLRDPNIMKRARSCDQQVRGRCWCCCGRAGACRIGWQAMQPNPAQRRKALARAAVATRAARSESGRAIVACADGSPSTWQGLDNSRASASVQRPRLSARHPLLETLLGLDPSRNIR